MREKRFLSTFFQLVLLGLMVISLVFIIQNLRGGLPASISQDTSTKVYPLPSEEASLGDEQPYPPPENSKLENLIPLCTFETRGALIDEPVTYVQYQFSEPRIVLKSETSIGIEGWLPDNRRLLISRYTQNGYKNIETYDILTGETHIYSEQYSSGPILWLDELQAVVYPAVVDDHDALWISYSASRKVEQIAPDIYNLSLASNGKDLVYFSPGLGDQPQIWRADTKTVQPLAIDLAAWSKPKLLNSNANLSVPGKNFKAVWQPGGNLIVFYGYPTLFFWDLSMSFGCEVDLGEAKNGLPITVLNAEWSPDGRFLAMRTTAHTPGTLVSFSELFILDIKTGKVIKPKIETRIVYEFAWSLDIQNIAILGDVGIIDRRSQLGLFIYNVKDKEDNVKQVFLDRFFGLNSSGMLAWSSNKERMAINCNAWSDSRPDTVESRICLIDITSQP